jgi:hypothetical protein
MPLIVPLAGVKTSHPTYSSQKEREGPAKNLVVTEET